MGLVCGMSCMNPMQAEDAESEIQFEANTARRMQESQMSGRQQASSMPNEQCNGFQEAIRLSLQDQDEKNLQQAIALSLAEAENNKKTTPEDSKLIVHDDLIDLGQNDLLDFADPAPAAITACPTIENELFDVFPVVTTVA